MDPRQPQQHPFGRNTSSPYGHGRSTFPPSTNPSPFPPSSHAPNAPPVYQEHQRRPSGPPYYAEQRGYPPQDGAPMPGPGPGHTRNQSSSSIGHSTPVMRERPPPFSPQQPPQQQPLHNSHSYGPPPPRPPPVSVGPPSAFPSGRELPGLPSLGRPPSTGMSISSMLGGPSREPAQSQYPPPIPSGPSNTSSNYAAPTHPSPRVAATSAPEYASYRRPQTPDHQRNYEVHDRRANSAGSPQGISQLTPEGARRWGTPQAHTYSQRPPQERAMPPADDRREQQPPQPIRVSNPNMPPRPSSQPTAFNPPPSRIPEGLRGPVERPMENVFGRREEHNPRAAELQSRPEPSYQRPPPFSDRERENPVYAYAERERRDRELAMQREHERERDREQRERAAIYERDRIKAEYDHRAQVVAQNQHRPPPETREQPAWMRPDYARPRPGYEQPVEQRPPPPQIPTTYDHHAATTAPYPASSAFAPTDPRLPPGSQPSSMPPQYGTVPASQYEANLQERQRIALAHQLQQQHEQQQSIYDRLPQRPPFPPHESPGRPPPEEAQQATQQRFLGVQEINRKGRVSPLPQAVQGAQAQIGTPGGEPGIKSEFGRMFSGIGSGVGGAMGAPSPVNTGPQNLPFSNSGQMRREDLENGVAQNSPIENGGHGIARSASRGGSRRRKLKEDDSRGDDEDSTGRQTPAFARGKRLKTGDHNHGPRRHHHHQRRPDDQVSSPSQSNLTPFKSVKGGSAIPSPPGHDIRDHPNLHHHIIPAPTPRNRNPTPVRAPPPNPEPIPKRIIRSNQAIESVAHLPRYHLGHEYYDPTLKPTSSNGQQPSIYGFASTPAPLPRFQGQENCTFTIKVPRVHLSHTSRAEITSRRALWGTDIYTDDSDVVAACIHEGWFRGAWSDDIDVDLLNLEIDGPWPTVSKGNANYDGEMTEPPPGGPMEVPKNRDLHVTILILPLLEKYSACIRFGIGSREWGGKHHGYTGVHDGVSFKIQKIKWVEGVDSYAGRIEGKKRMKLLPRAPDPNDPEELAPTQNGHHEGNNNGEMDGVIKESYERGGPTPLDSELGNIKGLGRNWWKEDRKGKQPKSKRVLAAVEKESQRNTEPLAVQEAEHINGNKDVDGRNGDGTASITAQTPPKPYKDRLADMFKRDDF